MTTIAGDPVAEIASLADKQRHVIKRLQSMMPPADSVVDGHATEETEDADFEPIAEIEGDVLDPITGEVVSKTHTGDETSQTPHVFVVWPHCNDAVRTEIGAHTTYGELVADYCSVALADGKVEDFNVVSEHGSARPLNKAIVPPDYGREFRIQEKSNSETATQEPAA